MIKFYGYKNCSSCRNAEKFLIQKKIGYEFIDITQHPPSIAELQTLITLAGVEIKKFLNTSGEVYRSLGLKDKITQLSREQLIDLMAANGRLIKRPLVTDGKKVTLGFKAEEFSSWKDS